MVVSRAEGRISNARYEPYPSGQKRNGRSTSDEGKENQSPYAISKKPTEKPGSSKDSNREELPSSYLDILLKEIKDEVPIYENASAIRRKLNVLITNKTKIPGSNKTFNKTSLSKELCAIAQAHHPIDTQTGFSNHGPSVNALSRFLKKSGVMAGGDSEAYYFGNMLLEKLRIWNGEKKTKAREKAEKEFPNGRQRVDPAHVRIWCRKDEIPTQSEFANLAR